MDRYHCRTLSSEALSKAAAGGRRQSIQEFYPDLFDRTAQLQRDLAVSFEESFNRIDENTATGMMNLMKDDNVSDIE